MTPNSKKLLTALFFLMTPWIMAFCLSFLLPTPTNVWVSILQATTLMMACGTSAAAGMVGWEFIRRETDAMQKWHRLGAIEVGR